MFSHEASWQRSLTTVKTYHIVLLVRDPKGLEGTDSLMIEVILPPEPVPDRMASTHVTETSPSTVTIVAIVQPTEQPRIMITPPPQSEVRTRPTPKPVVATVRPKPNSDAIAVLIVEDGKGIDRTLGSAIASRFQQRGVKTTSPSVFTTSFVNNGDFDRLFEGSLADGEQGQFPQYFQAGVLGKKSVSYVTNPEYDGLITAEVTLELHVVSSHTGTVQISVSWTHKGPGYSNADAKKIAEERILQEVETNLTSLIHAIQ
jgi:hypothetical protein